MHLNSLFTSSLILVGSVLVQGQNDYYGGSQELDTGSSQGNAAEGQSSQPSMSTETAAAVSGASETSSATTITSTVASASQGGAAPTDAAGTKVHVVQVGDVSGGLIFSPSDIKAAKGDVVQFQFYPRNHSVVQSTFDQPCQPISNNQPSVQGFFSGFMPVSQNSTTIPSYSVPITDTKPIWFYCSQGRHCQQGMVGVINAPASNTSRTLESYKALAAKAPQNLSPGQGSGASPSGSGAGGATTLSTSAGGAATGGPSGTGSNSSVTGTGPAAATGTNGVGSIRLDGSRQMVGTAAAVGVIALVMGVFM